MPLTGARKIGGTHVDHAGVAVSVKLVPVTF
jgi:hypothetical protein